ncbi:membrane protein SmpA [Asticcacaulis sp. AC460]|uniref:outer membrane protein assembly factor BamE n=1 Tax=Asticcacaulis sp. AC460 TaxID=1282360 RepID=UPI0003C3D1AA|nr:outer membrane protein assembly factor BamE [Asticcacaulis sp. AC460]ESQ89711.1 membrane protein SmpA [Asticcacaulis sp. AC460]
MRLPSFKTVALLSAATGLMVLASACAPTVTHNGYLAYDALPSRDIAVGDTKATVLDKLGDPSQTSTYKPTEWYYIDQTSQRMTYKQAKVTQRNVTVINFDPTGQTVTEVKTLLLADGRELTPNQNKTPTRGRALTALEQVLGTVGQQRIDNSSDTNPGGRRRRE